MTSEVFRSDIFVDAGRAVVLGEPPSDVEAPRPPKPRNEIWMNSTAVKSSVVVAAAVVIFNVASPLNATRAAVDPRAVQGETIVAHSGPAWLAAISRQVHSFLSLREGWDSYGAPPVSERATRTILAAIQSLASSSTPIPSVAPTPDGGVQVEWHERGVDLELRSDSEGRLYAFFNPANDPVSTWDAEIANIEVAASWFDRISSKA